MKLQPISKDPRKPYLFWCPGCDREHIIFTMGQYPHEIVFKDGEPTVSDVIKAATVGNDGNGSVAIETCEVFITDGLLRYTAACSHRFAGTYINMVDMDGNYDEVIRLASDDINPEVYDEREC
jgi:hypothetical protein